MSEEKRMPAFDEVAFNKALDKVGCALLEMLINHFKQYPNADWTSEEVCLEIDTWREIVINEVGNETRHEEPEKAPRGNKED